MPRGHWASQPSGAAPMRAPSLSVAAHAFALPHQAPLQLGSRPAALILPPIPVSSTAHFAPIDSFLQGHFQCSCEWGGRFTFQPGSTNPSQGFFDTCSSLLLSWMGKAGVLLRTMCLCC